MKNNQLYQKIILLLSSSSFFAFSLILFILSFSKETDEYGTSIDFNNDYLILVILGLITTLYTIYGIVAFYKNKKDQYQSIIGLTLSTISSFYPLSVFFKELNTSDSFSYQNYEKYLYIGIIFLFLILYFILKIVKEHQKN